MKKYLFSVSFILMAAGLQAQQLNTAADAVMYSSDNMNGTARFRAMSGAFGALGGDLSAMMVNPAGAAVFNYNTGTASLTSYNLRNNASYFGTKTRQNDNAFELNQIGAVFVFKSQNEAAALKKFTIGFNYENTNNFDNRVFTRGTNPNFNLSNYFLPYAQGITLNTLNTAFYENLGFNGQQAYLGYNAYIFDPFNPDSGNNTLYVANPNIAGGNPFYQENTMAGRGFNGKVAINFATQFYNWLFIGANLNVHFTDYIKTSSFYEEYNTGSATGLQAVRFNDERYTYGGGFSFNLGAIAKITESFRAGVAFESPTWFSLQDEIRQSIVSSCPECDVNSPNTNTFITDPGLIFITDDYSLRTPAKFTGSLAYVFGTSGLISVDAALKDYSSIEYSTRGFGDINNELSNNLDVAREIRVGAEYRIKSFSLRGGYRYEESPYKDNTIGDLKGFSAGIGFAFNNSRLDLAYSYFQRDMDQRLLDGGFAPMSARVTTDNNNITLSYSIDL